MNDPFAKKSLVSETFVVKNPNRDTIRSDYDAKKRAERWPRIGGADSQEAQRRRKQRLRTQAKKTAKEQDRKVSEYPY